MHGWSQDLGKFEEKGHVWRKGCVNLNFPPNGLTGLQERLSGLYGVTSAIFSVNMSAVPLDELLPLEH
jgi:hypothetical protein